MTDDDVSRNGQVIAWCWFAMGGNSSVVFNTPSRVTEKAMQGLNELQEKGFIILTDKDQIPRGSLGYSWIHNEWPRGLWPEPDGDNPDENFPVLKAMT